MRLDGWRVAPSVTGCTGQEIIAGGVEREMRLEKIQTIGIVGGGIAGLSFVYEIARNWDRLPKIIIFDPRFGASRPIRPNRTSGLIYRSLAEKYGMLEEGANVIAQEIETITFHKHRKHVEVPDPVGRRIYTVSKNPFHKGEEEIESVYQFLQRQLPHRDEIQFRAAYVLDIRFPGMKGEPYDIVFKRGLEEEDHVQKVDAVVVTTRPASIEKTLRRRIGYVPPRTWPAAVMDISLVGARDRSALRTLHKFLVGGGTAHTVDLIPHGEIVTVTAVGKEMTLGLLRRLLNEDERIRACLPLDWEERINAEHEVSIPVSAAKNLVHDGFAGLGGQVFGEILINGGLYNTLWASRILAEVIRDYGFAKTVLLRHYYAQVRNRLRLQNWAGRLVYQLSDRLILPSDTLAGWFLDRMEAEKSLPCDRRFMSHYVWDLLVGEKLLTSTVWGMATSLSGCFLRKTHGQGEDRG